MSLQVRKLKTCNNRIIYKLYDSINGSIYIFSDDYVQVGFYPEFDDYDIFTDDDWNIFNQWEDVIENSEIILCSDTEYRTVQQKLIYTSDCKSPKIYGYE